MKYHQTVYRDKYKKILDLANYPGFLNLLQNSYLSWLNSSLQLYEAEEINLLLSCYKQTKVNSRTWTGRKTWKYHVSQNNKSAPKLVSLPRTNEAFLENLKRIHIQAAIWSNSLSVNTPTFNPLDYSWAGNPSSPYLTPTTVTDGVN